MRQEMPHRNNIGLGRASCKRIFRFAPFFCRITVKWTRGPLPETWLTIWIFVHKNSWLRSISVCVAPDRAGRNRMTDMLKLHGFWRRKAEFA